MKQNELKNKCDNYLNIKMQCNSKYKVSFYASYRLKLY